MNSQPKEGLVKKVKNVLIGKALSPHDSQIFHKLSLIAFFAWVGLGSDGLSSACYGPEEAFLALQSHMFLGIFVALASAFTIFVIGASYSQIIELFPSGGGGYLVASKLLSPTLGMVSGCALLIDYILTITISVASGADALFSFLPYSWYQYKLAFAACVVLALIIMNMRGVKESVVPLIPIFLAFIVLHVFAIVYVIVANMGNLGSVASSASLDIQRTSSELGMVGMLILIMRAYSMGAGTFTGIEAVSNGIPMLREPKVQTAKRTMRYMTVSLAFMVVGLMLGYLLYRTKFCPGKTLNAVLFESISAGWDPSVGYTFVLVTLISEAVLLFVAAQTGFLDGPRVLSNMALDRWFPSRFSILSERFVTQNGILIMGVAAMVVMFASRGSVKLLVVLYSINVFITFFLSQLGMVRHWWEVKGKAAGWVRKLFINGVGLMLTTFILVSVIILKFHEGGWVTIFITGALVAVALFVKNHYRNTMKLMNRLDGLVEAARLSSGIEEKKTCSNVELKPDCKAKTAVILVSGYNGLGLHTLFNVLRLFKDNFKNYFFIQVGMIDAGNFKGTEELDKLKEHVADDLGRYVGFMRCQGYYAEGFSAIGIDIIDEIYRIAGGIYAKYPQAVFFGGQMVFPKDTLMTKVLYNYTTFAIQRKLYHDGMPFLIMPIRV